MNYFTINQNFVFCSRDQENREEFYCQVACENKRNWDTCPFRKTAQIQLDLYGNPIAGTPSILVKRRRKVLQNPGKYFTAGGGKYEG